MINDNLFQIERRFVDAIEQKLIHSLHETVSEKTRQILIDMQSAEADGSGISHQQLEVDVGNGMKMPIELIFPKVVSAQLGMVYYIHGGGWMLGDISAHRRLIFSLAKRIPAVIALPLYSLSHERQFPYVLEDLYKGLCFVAENAEVYGLNGKHLAVMGDSVGGNMATVLTFMAKENGFTPSISLQVLLYPVTDANFNTESYLNFSDGPWLSRAAMQRFWDMYLPDKDKRYNKEASPLQAFIDDLSCLPPALVVTAENDVLRDEGEAYARKLDEAGVPVVSVRFNGTLHDFMMLNALADTPASQAALSLTAGQLRYFLYNVE